MWPMGLLILSAQLSWNHSTEFREIVVMKDIMCRCAYPQVLIQFFFRVSHFLNLEIWPKWKILLNTYCQCNSSENTQQNFVKIGSNEGHDVHIHRKFWFIFSSLSFALFEFRNLAKMKDTTYSKQFASTTPLKLLNRISWNFVVMKDIMCRWAYPQEILIHYFFTELRPFLT